VEAEHAYPTETHTSKVPPRLELRIARPKLWVEYLHAALRGMTTSASPFDAASPTTRSWLGILNTAPETRRTQRWGGGRKQHEDAWGWGGGDPRLPRGYAGKGRRGKGAGRV